MTPNNRPAAIAVAIAVSLALTVPAAQAAIASVASFDEKVDNAAAIILGRCTRTESKFDPSGRWILTYSTFAIEKSLKGVTAGELTLVTPGGSVGSLHQSSVGIPAFREGDEHVIFVKNTRLGPTVLYFDQGAYEVRTDERGERIVAPVPTNLVKIDEQRGMAVAPNDEPRTLRQFESAIHESMRTAAERRQKMMATPPVKPRATSIVSTLADNKLLLVLALTGLALAAWQLRRR
jgi:hypothetical protein